MLKTLTILIPVLLLGACTRLPTKPSVLVLPGTGKDFNQFHIDDQDCRQFVYKQMTDAQKKGDSGGDDQQSYDMLYIQCMYGKGHRVPVPGGLSYDARQDWHPPPPPNMPAPR
jgi:hypothetical protein